MTHADVVVIGGGINGTGVARDCALRGLKVVLFERNDLAFGASGNSSGMIHGGPRYLSKSPNVTRTSCLDSGYIQTIAPFLLFRIPFLMPIERGKKGRVLLELVDAYFRAYDDFQPLKRGEPHTRLTPDEVRSLEPGLVGDFVGGVTFDEWGVDGARLCTLNAIDAREHGADIHVHTTVESIEQTAAAEMGSASAEDGYRWRVRARKSGGGAISVHARAVVNATGAWAPVTASFASQSVRRPGSGGEPLDDALGDTLGRRLAERARVRPGKGIHVVYERRLSNYALLGTTIDGRQVFLEPWENMSVLGTTDDDYYGDLDDVVATSEEVRYLVQAVARVFPTLREARAIGTFAGVRPTLYAYGPHEDALSREHEIQDHGDDGAPGLYSMVGGKLASYRIFAEQMTDTLCRRLGVQGACSTHRRVLPGADGAVDDGRLAEAWELPPVAARRLVYRHGSRAERVTERLASEPRQGSVVCPCEPVTEAEIRHVVREEWAETVEDVSRRTRLGLGACGGLRCAERCGQILADERGLAAAEGRRQAMAFVERLARARVPALGPVQARQESLLHAHLCQRRGGEEAP